MADYVYKLLTQDEQDETMASFLLSQEHDLYSHQINKTRFEEMLKTLPEGAFKNRIQDLKDQTVSRINEVQSIIDASQAQLPDAARLQAAITRLQAAKRI